MVIKNRFVTSYLKTSAIYPQSKNEREGDFLWYICFSYCQVTIVTDGLRNLLNKPILKFQVYGESGIVY